MKLKEQFNEEWAKLSVLKDPIQKHTAEFFFMLGARAQLKIEIEETIKLKSDMNIFEHGN